MPRLDQTSAWTRWYSPVDVWSVSWEQWGDPWCQRGVGALLSMNELPGLRRSAGDSYFWPVSSQCLWAPSPAGGLFINRASPQHTMEREQHAHTHTQRHTNDSVAAKVQRTSMCYTTFLLHSLKCCWKRIEPLTGGLITASVWDYSWLSRHFLVRMVRESPPPRLNGWCLNLELSGILLLIYNNYYYNKLNVT